MSVSVYELNTTAAEMIQRENPITEYNNSIIFGYKIHICCTIIASTGHIYNW